MSGQISANGELFVRQNEIDEGSYLRIRQIRPVERAAAPIIDHNIQLTETACEVRPWYRGETRLEPSAYMSILLDPGKNSAVGYLCAFADTVKAFAPGAFPGHCYAVRELEFTTKHLINTLATLTDAAAFTHSLRCLGAFFATISDPANTALPRHDLVQRIDTKLDQLVDSFRGISREFAMREREIVFRAIPHDGISNEDAARIATKTAETLRPSLDDIQSTAEKSVVIAAETNKTVKRIDARDVKRGKRQTEIDRQEKCYALWMAGQGKEGVIALAGKRRISRNDVFEYYKREFKAINVGSAVEFVRCLHARAQRLSRQAVN